MRSTDINTADRMHFKSGQGEVYTCTEGQLTLLAAAVLWDPAFGRRQNSKLRLGSLVLPMGGPPPLSLRPTANIQYVLQFHSPFSLTLWTSLFSPPAPIDFLLLLSLHSLLTSDQLYVATNINSYQQCLLGSKLSVFSLAVIPNASHIA